MPANDLTGKVTSWVSVSLLTAIPLKVVPEMVFPDVVAGKETSEILKGANIRSSKVLSMMLGAHTPEFRILHYQRKPCLPDP